MCSFTAMASGKLVNLSSGEGESHRKSNNIQCETSLLLQAILKHVVFKDFILKVNKKSKGSHILTNSVLSKILKSLWYCLLCHM